MASPEPNSSLFEIDMLSNLPEDMKQKILTYLPIKEAGRTSILSSKWRNTWAFMTELVLTDDIYTSNLIEFVDTIFLLHNGPIHKFSLFTNQDCYKALDKWIINLSRNVIRELTLDVSGHEYVMHSRLFSCQELNAIVLNNFTFKLPLYFKGFKCLHVLALVQSKVSASDIENLISGCPLLEELALIDLKESVGLNINAPNLQFFEIRTEFSDLQVRAPKLLSLYVCLKTPPTNQPCSNKFEQVLGNVSALKRFELSRYFLQYLGAEPFREGYSLTFNHLEYMDFGLDFADQKEAAFALAMFRRMPHLKSLDIDMYLTERRASFSMARFWEKIDRKEGLFKHLQAVHIYGFKIVGSILSFVEFILGSAPRLVTLTIEKDPKEEQDERSKLRQLQDEGIMLRQLLSFERASPKAKIIF